jgi:DNA-binding MarR family transcriptional regulator
MNHGAITAGPGFGPGPEQFPQLANIQQQLDQLRDKLLTSTGPDTADGLDDAVLCRLAKEILRSRRQREKIFGADLFGEPAWDILLELYAAGLGQQKLSVSGACYASAVPHTTGLRWVLKLEKDGWIRRVNDPFDGRRSWVELTEEALAAMRNHLIQLALRAQAGVLAAPAAGRPEGG